MEEIARHWPVARKARLGPGVWSSEPDKVQFPGPGGYPCIMVRSTNSGVWLGYVGVTAGHPYFLRDYDEMPHFDVHGGLTYAGLGWSPASEQPELGITVEWDEPGDPEIWWIGFDCNHWGDCSPVTSHYPLSDRDDAGVYRNLEYVRAHVTELAEQILATSGRGLRREEIGPILAIPATLPVWTARKVRFRAEIEQNTPEIVKNTRIIRRKHRN